MSIIRYEVYPRLTIWGRRWFWRAVGRNGRKVGWGEAYHNKQDAWDAADLMRGSATARCVELSADKEEMP